MATKKNTRRITKKKISLAIKAVEKDFSIWLSEEQARAILKLDFDLLDELGRDGILDTAGRAYFADALIEFLIPGPPKIQDGGISFEQTRWHWPLNLSSEEYEEAFLTEFREALKKRDIPISAIGAYCSV
jgi:hypothetical protein